MAETFTMNETPSNPEILNSDEQESLAIAESLEQGEQPLLAGKFKDTQALEQAYVELQKKLGEPRDEVPAPEDEGEPAETEPETEETDDDSEGLSEKQAEMLMDMVGGNKAYKSMLDWAAQNFSEAEIQAFDNVVDSGNVAAINLALAGLQARYTDANGYEGKMIQGKAAAPADTFKSQAEVVRAMNDSRYDRDPAYRTEIMEKLARSDLKF